MVMDGPGQAAGRSGDPALSAHPYRHVTPQSKLILFQSFVWPFQEQMRWRSLLVLRFCQKIRINCCRCVLTFNCWLFATGSIHHVTHVVCIALADEAEASYIYLQLALCNSLSLRPGIITILILYRAAVSTVSMNSLSRPWLNYICPTRTCISAYIELDMNRFGYAP